MRFFKALYSLLPLAFTSTSHASTYEKYSTWMLESIIFRGKGISAADGLLGEIQKGFFQEAVRAAIKSTKIVSQAEQWSDYHSRSVQTGINDLLNATTDAKAPLDRLCVGRSLLFTTTQASSTHQAPTRQVSADNQIDLTALKALRKSIDLQLRSANGGLWYFVDPPPPYETYGNLSYSDGMYGFAPFATLYGQTFSDVYVNVISALHQLELIYHHCLHQETGLLVHGYDASRHAPWADSITGASPINWGRSIAWYTIGLVDALEVAYTFPNPNRTRTHTRAVARMRTIFQQLALAEIAAIRKSAYQTGRYGVWQVFDMPGEPENFVEASASAMITYALAKGIRLGYFEGIDYGGAVLREQTALRAESAPEIVRALYNDLLTHFVIRNENGTLDYTGTSVIASLHVPKPDYYYYTHRNVTTNSLIGTSAFVLASLEVERQ